MRRSLLVGGLATSLALAHHLSAAPPASKPAPSSRELLTEAVSLTAKITDADERADMLNYITLAQARTGDVEGAKRTAVTIAVPLKKGFAYGHIAAALSERGDVAGAEGIAKFVEDPSGVYESIVEAAAAKGDVAGAKAAMANVTNPFLLGHAYEHVAMAQAKAGDAKGAKATVAGISGAGDVKAGAYVHLAIILSKAGKGADARAMVAAAVEAMKTAPDFLAPMVASDIAQAETTIGDLPSAMRRANQAAEPSSKELILSHIAVAQVEGGKFPAAKATIDRLTDPSDKCGLEARLARAQSAHGDAAAAGQSLRTATTLLDKVQPAPLRSIYAGEVALAQGTVNGAAAAASWARSQKDPEVRVRALLGVVESMPDYREPANP